jgi:PAS domain S-box-containing protein
MPGGGRRPSLSWRGLILKISVIAAVVVVAVVAQVVYDLWRSHERQIHDAERNAANLVRLLDEQTARTFQAVDLTLRATADAVSRIPKERADYDKAVHDTLGSFTAQVPFVRAIFVVDREGVMRHVSNAMPAPPLDNTDRDYFKALRAPSTELYVGSPVFSRTTGLWFVSASLRLVDAEGQFAGVIVAAVEPEYFLTFYKSIDVGQEGSLSLFLRDGRLLVQSSPAAKPAGTSFADSLLFRDRLPVARQGVFTLPAAEDRPESIVGYRSLEGLPFVVSVALSEREVLRDWWSNLLVYVPILGIFVCFVGVLMAFLLRELRQREELSLALRQNSDRLRLALESSETGTWTWDEESDRSIGDENVMRIFGVTAGPYARTGEEFLNSVHPDDRDEVRQAIAASMTEKTPYDIVYRIHRSDGAVRWIHSRGEAMRRADGKPNGMIGVCSDITTHRRAEEALVQGQRMEVVSQLTGGVAHDFNNLLQVVLGNAEILTDGLAGNPTLRRWAEMTKVAAERGAELTRRLMAFARRQALEPSEVNVNRLLVDMTDTLRRSLGDFHLVADFSEDLWLAHVDSVQLENAILNLILNSRDATPTDGRVTVATANRELSRQDCAGSDELTPGRYVIVSVADSGVGMSPDVLKRCCEPFFTTKDVGAGSGLGLSMVYGFMKQSGGHLTIASKPGEGTTVTLYLPWAGLASLELPQPILSTSHVLPGGVETVLVVDDDPLVRGYVCEQITQLGYAVIECADGDAALDVLRRGEDVDLLFSDILMPGGLDGIALVEAALAICPQLKVLLTSGDAHGVVGDERRLAGRTVLEKPYRKDELAETLRRILDRPA